MRKLKGRDTFTLLNLIGKLEIKDAVLEMFDSESTSSEKKTAADIQEKGQNIMVALLDVVINKLPLVEEDINRFLSDLTEKKQEEIEDLDFDVYMDLIISFFEKEELKDFFQSITLRLGKVGTK